MLSPGPVTPEEPSSPFEAPTPEPNPVATEQFLARIYPDLSYEQALVTHIWVHTTSSEAPPLNPVFEEHLYTHFGYGPPFE